MKPEKSWKPLVITGAVLLLNGLVLLSIALIMQSSGFWGAAIACLGLGVPLLITGLLQNKKSGEQTS